MTDPTKPGGTNGGGYDPWAPPESRQPADPDGPSGGPATPGQPPSGTPAPPSVHDQATVTSMPSTGYPPPGGPTPFDTAGHAPYDTGGPAPYGTGGPSPYDTAGHAPYDTTGAVPPPPTAPGGPQPGGYGYPGYPQGYGWTGAPMAPQNGMGTAAMVLGILACALFCFYGAVSIVLGVLAIVFGVKGKKRAEQGVATNRGQAQAGLITGIIGLILGIAVLVLMVIGFTTAFNEFEEQDSYYDDPYYGAHSAPLDVTRAA
ncbi:DUF4190 domain-containing protein [Streptomyces sp. NPDC059477]|uniref:DUF4190 domain-containing protein n=1 Tax=Streptomyces sp. NPDC059477 TaxID=3346847 RepID=UPI00368786B9